MPNLTGQQFVNSLRTKEIETVLSRYRHLFSNKTVLELGSGSGAQLLALSKCCLSAVGVEVSVQSDALAPVIPYDGKHLPFPDSQFDLVFSSHVIEHIKHETEIHSEIHRVLRSGGVCVHVVPSIYWRLLASALHYPALAQRAFMKLRHTSRDERNGHTSSELGGASLARWRARLSYALVPKRHGEFGTWITEPFLFRQKAWRKRFESHGWTVVSAEPFGYVQSGHYLLRQHLSFNSRQKMAGLLGPPAFLFILTPNST